VARLAQQDWALELAETSTVPTVIPNPPEYQAGQARGILSPFEADVVIDYS
jgi:hypothetical protein